MKNGASEKDSALNGTFIYGSIKYKEQNRGFFSLYLMLKLDSLASKFNTYDQKDSESNDRYSSMTAVVAFHGESGEIQ